MDTNDEIKSLKDAINDLSARVYTLEAELKTIKNRQQSESYTSPVQGYDLPGETNPYLQDTLPGKFSDTSYNFKPEPVDPVQTQEVPRKQNIEFAIGSTWFNRIGIILVILGIGFFLKYSFDNHWIGVVGRIVIGYIASIAFMAAGEVLYRKKNIKFSMGFTGGGIALVYLTTYAAVHFYHLVPDLAGFLILIFAAITGAVLSVKYNAYPIAVLSTVGGFATPVVIGGDGSFTLLLSYVLVLNIGVLILAYHKNWQSLNIICFAGTVIYSLGALSDIHYNNTGYQNTLPYELFILAFFVIFNALTFIYNIKNKKATSKKDVALVLFNSLIFYGITYEELSQIPQFMPYMGFLTALIAIYYFATYMIIQKKELGDKLIRLTMLTTGFTFLTIALPVQMDGYAVSMSWIAEGVAIVYIGFRLNNYFFRVAGNLLLFITTFVISLDTMRFASDHLPVFNIHSMTQLLGVIGIFIVSRLYARYGDKLMQLDKRQQYRHIELSVANLILVAANFFLLFYLAKETRLFADYYQITLYIGLWQLVILGLCGIAVTAYAFRYDNIYLKYFNMLILGILALLVIFEPILYGTGEQLPPLFNPVSFAYIILIGMFMMFIILPARYPSTAAAQADTKLHIPVTVVGNIFALLYLLNETYLICSYFNIHEISKFAVSLVWLIYAVAALWYGIRRTKRYVRIMAQALFAFIVLKVLFYDLSQIAIIYKIMLLVLVGSVLVGISFLYQRFIRTNENS